MYLKKFGMYMTTERESQYHLAYRIYFLKYSLTKFLRKIKFETDGTFSGIVIYLDNPIPNAQILEEIRSGSYDLVVDLPFDFEKYENSDDETRCKYYIELVRQGLELASKVKKIPYDEMMEFLHHLAENNFTYTWDFKNVIDWENNLKVKFVAELGTNDFILKAQVFTRRPKELICQGQVARTKPDQIHFSLLSKYIRLEDGRINFYCNSQQILFLEVKELIAGKVIVHFNREDGFAQFAEGVLTYDNYDFR